MAAKFSIRYKFLGVMTLLLTFCVGVYLFLATTIITSDKTELVFDYNRSLVSNLSSELEGLLGRVSDKMKLSAHFYREKKRSSRDLIQGILENSREIAFVGGSERFQKIDLKFYQDKTFVETYGLQSTYFEQNPKILDDIPFQKIQTHGEALWNATVGGGPPLIGFGRSVIEEDESGQPVSQFAVIAFVKPDQIIKSMERSQLNEIVVTDNNGNFILGEGAVREVGEEASPLVAKASSYPLKTNVLEFVAQGGRFLGAFSKAYKNKIYVLSHVSYGKAFSVVDRLLYRSVIFALIVVTLAFMGAILLSRSITRPIDHLVSGMEKVSAGDLGVRMAIESKDEVAVLAGSFNQMIGDLSQSRKALEEVNKNLENKVKERTLQLEEQNLAVKEAQEALLRTTRLASIGEIAGQAAHEVLNPLTSIISRLQTMKARLSRPSTDSEEVVEEIIQSWEEDFNKGGFDELLESWKAPSEVMDGKSLFEEDVINIKKVQSWHNEEFQGLAKETNFVLDESERISRIVNSMRTLSVVGVELKHLGVHELVDRSIKIMADLAGKYNVEVEFVSEASDDHCMLEPDEFLQATTNLLRNGIQAIGLHDISNGKIFVRSHNEGDKLLLDITDNGAGISILDQQRIFKTQFTTKPKSHGTGLGLSISRRFLRAIHGDIELLASAEGQGSTFRMVLPLAKVVVKKESA